MSRQQTISPSFNVFRRLKWQSHAILRKTIGHELMLIMLTVLIACHFSHNTKLTATPYNRTPLIHQCMQYSYITIAPAARRFSQHQRSPSKHVWAVWICPKRTAEFSWRWSQVLLESWSPRTATSQSTDSWPWLPTMHQGQPTTG